MSKDLQNAVDSLRSELQTISRRSTEIMKAMNQLNALMGLPPEFTDIDLIGNSMGTVEVTQRQFVGKGMLDSVKEYLKMVDKASTAQEILAGLNQGDFEFPSNWKKNLKLKNLAIFLGSNKEFVDFNTKEGKAYGLVERYPDRKKEKERGVKESLPKNSTLGVSMSQDEKP